MKPEELVNKLRKAGINASLVHKIHDEALISIDTETIRRELYEPIKVDVQKVWEALNKGAGVGFHYRTDSDSLRPDRSPSQCSMDDNYPLRRYRQFPYQAPQGGRLRPTRGDSTEVSGRGKGGTGKG